MCAVCLSWEIFRFIEKFFAQKRVIYARRLCILGNVSFIYFERCERGARPGCNCARRLRKLCMRFSFIRAICPRRVVQPPPMFCFVLQQGQAQLDMQRRDQPIGKFPPHKKCIDSQPINPFSCKHKQSRLIACCWIIVSKFKSLLLFIRLLLVEIEKIDWFNQNKHLLQYITICNNIYFNALFVFWALMNSTFL